MKDAVFSPPFYLKPAIIQSIFASSRFRANGSESFDDSSALMILDVGDGVRLMGRYNSSPDPSRGLVILLHGWEGGSSSAYILSAGSRLHRLGYSVFRLNLRDHGDTHHLNEGLFFATLIDETFEAIKQATELAGSEPVYLAGFSLGGNFVLRLGLKLLDEPIGNVKRIVAVSPALDPAKSTSTLDGHPLFRWYFAKKWKRSLKRKQELYPSRYDFTKALAQKTIQAMTDVMIRDYSDYGSSSEYFSYYTLSGDALKKMETPTTIITAEDDPIIPPDDFRALNLNPKTELIIHKYGGHIGFLEDMTFSGWHETYMEKHF